jgi:hypothetical protein
LAAEKSKIEKEITRLKQYKTQTYIDPQKILELCEEIHQGIDQFGFTHKRRTLELLQVNGVFDFDTQTINIDGLFVCEEGTSHV